MTELRPCYAFTNNTLQQQFEKILEEIEAALNSVAEQLNMGMIRPRHGKRLIQMYRRQLERKREERKCTT